MPWEKTSRKISLSVPTELWVGSDDGSGAPNPSSRRVEEPLLGLLVALDPAGVAGLVLEPALGEVAERAHDHAPRPTTASTATTRPAWRKSPAHRRSGSSRR